MPELETITVKGFKSIASIEKLKLNPINVLIGPNGSGKSNLIGVFSFLNAIREGKLQEYVIKAGGADKILYFGSKTTQEIGIEIVFRNEINQYEITLGVTDADQLYPKEEWVYFWNKERGFTGPLGEGLSPRGLEAGISVASGAIAVYVRRHLASWRLYHFHDTSASSPMKKTANVNDNRFLRPDGSNLAAFLYLLKLKHQESYSLIQRTIRLVAPFFDDFQLEPKRGNEDTILLEWRHKDSDAYFNASSLSDGTLRFIALATLFLQPAQLRPSVILVDEPEIGLHPYAITVLASMMKQAATNTQVIAGTQSPQLLDNFAPEDVLVANLVEGATQLTRLDSLELGEWLKTYSLGQLWEKNEFGGRP